MTQGLVSVIITTFKRPAEVLKRAIESVKNQTYGLVELIVINDSPEYEERRKIDLLVNSYKLEYIVNPVSKGAAVSRNVGLQHAKGEFVAFLDDDDEWLENKLDKIIPFFNDKKVGLVYCDFINRTKFGDSVVHLPEFKSEDVLMQLLNRNYIGGFSGPVIRRQALIDCGMMDENLLSSQDADLWRRLSKICIFHHVDEPLLIYYVSDESITANPQKRLQGTIRLLTKYENEYKLCPKIRKKHVDRSIQNYIRSGWKKEAEELYRYEYKGMMYYKNLYVFALGYLKKIVDRWR